MALQVAQEAAEALQTDYGEDADTLFASMHFLDRDVIQRKLAGAILRPFTDGRGQEVNPFVIAFAGTSVTAAHDCYFNQSYPSVFGRELNRSFLAAGLDLVIRNHAMGNNPVIPPCFCVATQLGWDTDVAVWEFEFDAQGGSAVASVETWIRNALSLPKQPAIMILDGGEGARKPGENGKLPTDPRLQTPPDWSRHYAEGGRALLSHYRGFGIHAQVSR